MSDIADRVQVGEWGADIEAAAEIRRLEADIEAKASILTNQRDEIERLSGNCTYYQEFAEAKMAEIEQLEAELKWFKENWLAEVEHTRFVHAATTEKCAKLEQIRQVCADNAGEGSNHKIALDFVHQIAIRALKEQP